MADEDQYGHQSMDSNAYFRAIEGQALVEQLRFLFNPQEIVEEFRNYLLGKRWNPKSQTLEQDGEERMNIIGVNDLLALVEPRVSKLINLSWFQEDRINVALLEFAGDLNSLFVENHEKYGITLANAERLKHHAYSLVEANYMRALNGRSYNLLIKTTKFIQETKVENKDIPQKQPGIGPISGWFGKRRAY